MDCPHSGASLLSTWMQAFCGAASSRQLLALEGATEPGTCTTTPCRGLVRAKLGRVGSPLALLVSSEVSAAARQRDPHSFSKLLRVAKCLIARTASWNSEPHRPVGLWDPLASSCLPDRERSSGSFAPGPKMLGLFGER